MYVIEKVSHIHLQSTSSPRVLSSARNIISWCIARAQRSVRYASKQEWRPRNHSGLLQEPVYQPPLNETHVFARAEHHPLRPIQLGVCHFAAIVNFSRPGGDVLQ